MFAKILQRSATVAMRQGPAHFNAVRQMMTINSMRATQMVQARQVMGTASIRWFSEKDEGTITDNEIIELVEGKVFEVLKSAAKCNHSKLSRTATFEELGFDSLDGVELVLAMEEHFGFDLTNEDAEKINTVMDAIQIFHSYVMKRLSVQEGEGDQKAE